MNSIKNPVSHLIKVYRNILLRIKWFIQYINYKHSLSNQVIINKIQDLELKNKNILILIPHADDELIGCYQIINKYKDQIKCFYFGFTGSSTDVPNAKTRLMELMRISSILGLNLSISKGNYKNELSSIIYKFKPEIIFVPSFVDWHQEHIYTNIILRDVLIESGFKCLISSYQISVPISEMSITHCIKMSQTEQKTKWQLFQNFYLSQKNIPVFRFILNEKLSGVLFGCYAAEVYRIYSNTDIWINSIGIFEKYTSAELLSSIAKNINNIITVRKESKKIYEIVANVIIPD